MKIIQLSVSCVMGRLAAISEAKCSKKPGIQNRLHMVTALHMVTGVAMTLCIELTFQLDLLKIDLHTGDCMV